MKQYLKPGVAIIVHGGPATVGLSCSVVDLNLDWSGVEQYGRGEVDGDQGIGRIVIERWFYVFRDIDGRLFYDDELGF